MSLRIIILGGFSVLMEILAGFPVYDRPQCPPPYAIVEKKRPEKIQHFNGIQTYDFHDSGVILLVTTLAMKANNIQNLM